MMLSETKRYNIQVEGSRAEGDVKLVEVPEGDLVYYYEMRLKVDAMEMQINHLKKRLAEMGEVEIDLHAKIIQLESDIQGPDGFATWQDAATSERMKRITGVKRIAELEEREMEATQLVERWLQTDKKHDWVGFQKRVEKYLGVNQPEPIPPGIMWRGEHGNFYNAQNKGQGEAFLVKWFDRRQEFPSYLRDCIGTWP